MPTDTVEIVQPAVMTKQDLEIQIATLEQQVASFTNDLEDTKRALYNSTGALNLAKHQLASWTWPEKPKP